MRAILDLNLLFPNVVKENFQHSENSERHFRRIIMSSAAVKVRNREESGKVDGTGPVALLLYIVMQQSRCVYICMAIT